MDSIEGLNSLLLCIAEKHISILFYINYNIKFYINTANCIVHEK